MNPDADCHCLLRPRPSQPQRPRSAATSSTTTSRAEPGRRQGAVHDWTIDGNDGGVPSVGVGAGLRGRPAGGMVIDGPSTDRKEAASPTYRQTLWDWWTKVAATRLAPGGRRHGTRSAFATAGLAGCRQRRAACNENACGSSPSGKANATAPRLCRWWLAPTVLGPGVSEVKLAPGGTPVHDTGRDEVVPQARRGVADQRLNACSSWRPRCLARRTWT
jgi:hypothetical protein